MTIQAAFALLSTVTCLGIGWVVYTKNPRKTLNRTWGCLNLFVAAWSLGNFLLLLSSQPDPALFWARMGILSACVIPATFLHFTLALLGIQNRRWILRSSYAMVLVNAFLTRHPLLIIGVGPRLGFSFFPVAGSLYWIHVISFYGYIGYALYLMFRGLEKTKGYRRERLLVILACSLIGVVSGATHHWSSFIPQIPPIGIYVEFLYPIGITLAIFRYHLLGIKIADRIPRYYQQVKLASQKMAEETKLHELVETILEIIRSGVHPEFCQLLFSKDQGNRLEFLFANGRLGPSHSLSNDCEDFFVEWFSLSRDPISREKLEFLMEQSPPSLIQESTLKKMHSTLDSLDVELCIPAFHQEKLMGIFLLGEKRHGVYSERDLSFLGTLANDAATAIRNTQLMDQLRGVLQGLIEAFAITIGKVDPEFTFEHVVRTRAIAMHLVKKLREHKISLGTLSEELFLAGILLHDLGKVFTPKEILHKASPLTEEEWTVMRRHPADGAQILSRISGLEELALIVRHHQERWDGKGYPDGLKTEDISIGAQVAAVADAFDAMTSDRPYRKGLSRQEAMEELKRNAGTQFSPKIVKIMEELYEEGSLG